MARGPVITLTGGARPDGVFAQVELPALLRNPAVTSIDGIPTDELRRLSHEQAFALVTAASEQRAATLRLPVDASGRPLPADVPVPIDSRAFLADLPAVQASAPDPSAIYRPMVDFIPPERLRQHQSTFLSLRQDLAARIQPLNQAHQIGERLDLSRLVGRLDDGLAVTGLALAALEAHQAYAGGDRDTAQRILHRWALDNAGALLAGRLAALALAPLVASGPLGVLLAGGLTLGASALGSSAAEPAMNALVEGLARSSDAAISLLQRLIHGAETAVSPLILDLDGNGVRSRSLAQGVNFDHEGNGFLERSGWVGDGDGLLVRDLDGDGRISQGRELFGNHTRLRNGHLAGHGFEALRDLDANGDGQVDHRDAAWSSLRIWIDSDADASTDPGELHELGLLGVQALPHAYRQADILDPEGNRHRQLGAYLGGDGSRRDLTDVWFQMDPTRSRLASPIAVPAAIAALPDLSGLGTTASLHQVMAADPASALIPLLQQWRSGSSGQRRALMEPILLAWTGVQEAMPPGSEINPALWRRLLALQQLLGRHYHNVPMTRLPLPRALAELESGFRVMEQTFDQLLAMHSDLPPLLRLLRTLPSADGSPLLMADLALEALRQQQGSQPDGGRLVRIVVGLAAMAEQGEAVLAALLRACDGRNDSLSLMLRTAAANRPLLQSGTAWADSLDGSASSSWLEGQDGGDHLVGGGGRDVLVGGRGSDTLAGGHNSDLYLIASGDGDDRINDADGSPGSLDEVRFVDLPASAVQVERLGSDLALIHPGGGRVLVLNHFGADWTRIDRVSFRDGETWTQADLRDRAVIGGASEGHDRLGGYNEMPCRISALGGHDTLLGGDHPDLLDGGSGDDLIQAGAGADTLIGGGGNDTLQGGHGGDLYRIRRGSALTQILDLDNGTAADTVWLEDRLPDTVQRVERLSNDLLLRFSDGEALQVLNHFGAPNFRIEQFRFSDGSLWQENVVLQQLVVGGATAGNDRLGGFHAFVHRIVGLDGHDTLTGGNLGDTLQGGSGNDSLLGHDGPDLLEGQAGDDTLLGGGGNDTLIAGGGNDSLSGGGGSDTYQISGTAWRCLIQDFDPTAAKRDVVRFTDLRVKDVRHVLRQGNHLTLRFKTGAELSVPHQFTSSAHGLDAFHFANGTTWLYRDLFLRAQVVS